MLGPYTPSCHQSLCRCRVVYHNILPLIRRFHGDQYTYSQSSYEVLVATKEHRDCTFAELPSNHIHNPVRVLRQILYPSNNEHQVSLYIYPSLFSPPDLLTDVVRLT